MNVKLCICGIAHAFGLKFAKLHFLNFELKFTKSPKGILICRYKTGILLYLLLGKLSLKR